MLGSLTALCGAQALAASSPRFIVATIKPSDPNRAEADGNLGFAPSGSFDAKSQSLKEIIEFVQDFGYYNVDQPLSLADRSGSVHRNSTLRPSATKKPCVLSGRCR